MSVYAIAQLWIHDPARYGRYVERFMEVFKKYTGRVLAADESPVVFEGPWDGSKVVVLSFPDEASFRDWAESAEYQEIAEDRKAAARSVIVMVHGFAGRDDQAKKRRVRRQGGAKNRARRRRLLVRKYFGSNHVRNFARRAAGRRQRSCRMRSEGREDVVADGA
jgi:uncharacterized protein (DUF1330 family)